ncbi:MAG: glycosyl hydrolase [Bacillota bacterium]|nr:glycosyl hydrolase [Bacillota bacterium]
MNLEQLREQFLNPADEFGPIPFWFWNDHLTEEEITRQIQDFKAKGVNGFVIHPRIGIPKEIEYLSDRFMELVACAVEAAEKLGMQVILYDEGMYPSGSAHGKVVASNPRFASRGLQLREYAVSGHLELKPELEPDDRLVSIQAAKKIDEKVLDPKSLLILTLEEDRIVFTAPDQEQWVLMLFVETYSRGTIRGIHFGEDDGQPGAPPSADLLNPEAVKAFIECTHERYYQYLSRHFGHTVIAMFTDEPAILGRRGKRGLRPWTDGFLEWYRKFGGSELDLAALWFEAGEETGKKRRLYKQAVNALLEQSYYRQISEWCAGHNIALTGHPERSTDIGVLKHFQIPGQDVVWRWVAPENNLAITGEHSTMAKCSSDAARHAGLRRNANECFGCCGPDGIHWAFSVRDMKWYMDWLFVRGVNLLYPHAFFYSIDGKGRYDERPPDVGPNNIWWPHYRVIADYIKRLSWLNTDSVNQAQVAVLCEPDHLPWQIVQPLYEHQIEFNYLENRLFAEKVKVEGGKLAIAAQKYSVLLVEDPVQITPEVESVLTDFAKQDGAVLIFNLDRQKLPWEWACEIRDLGRLVPELEKRISRDFCFEPTCSQLRCTHVVKDYLHLYLLVNEGDQPIAGTAEIDQQGCVEVWDAWSGTTKKAPVKINSRSKTSIDVQLAGRQSMIITVDPRREPAVEQESPAAAGAGKPRAVITETITLDGGWRIADSPLPMDVGHQLRSWVEFEGMENYSGTFTYLNQFDLDPSKGECQQIVLDLGEVWELAAVEINGADAGVCLLPPYQFDLTEYVQPGSNRVRVSVTNSRANELAGAKITSGMLGPVTVRVVRQDSHG